MGKSLAIFFLLFLRAFGATFTFQAPTSLTTEGAPLAVAAADFNSDGFEDLAVANAGSETVSVFLELYETGIRHANSVIVNRGDSS